MEKFIIGIVAKEEEINNTKYLAITKNNLKYLYNKCSFIGLLSYDNKKIDKNVLRLCDGIIIPGGKDIYPYHFQIIKYAIANNIPLMGICMGHQAIGLYSTNSSEKDLIKINNHYSIDDNHKIKIKKNSALHNIFGDEITVNSRHLFKVKKIKKPFKIVAYSDDNTIEAIEYIDKNHFILGIQWHPEDLNNMEKLYNLFFNKILCNYNRQK